MTAQKNSGTTATRTAVVFEVIPHPQHRGSWLLEPNVGAPYGLWYGELRQAVSYAEWVAHAQNLETAEIIVRNRDGTVAERRVIGRAQHDSV